MNDAIVFRLVGTRDTFNDIHVHFSEILFKDFGKYGV